MNNLFSINIVDKTETGVKVIAWCLRFTLGFLFIFSGFVKGIDPWGTLYKVDDYLAVFNFEIWGNLKLVGVFFLNFFEFVLGIFIFLGCFRKISPIIGLIFMLFMIPLTFWIAINNPVSDCGCFGDALTLSNWNTFWKNIIITLGLIFLIKFNTLIPCLVTPALQWILLTISGIFIVIIEFLGYNYQPLIDFRQYKNGTELLGKEEKSYEPAYVFIYEKDGVKQYFNETDNLPEEADGWNFIDREEIKNNQQDNSNNKSNYRDLYAWNPDTDIDETEEAINLEGKELILMIPDLKNVSPATTWKINSLYEWCRLNNVKFIAIVAGTKQDIEEWEDMAIPEYPVYLADDTKIKEIVRGNPGVVYIVDGKIKWKSTLTFINIDDFLSPDISKDASEFSFDNKSFLFNLSAIYILVVIVLIFLSFTPGIMRMIFRRKEKFIDDDKILP